MKAGVNMSVEPGVDVTVNNPQPPPETEAPPADAGADVVVVEAPAPSADTDLAVLVGQLSARMEIVENAAREAGYKAEDAQGTASAAIETAVDTAALTEEIVTEEVEAVGDAVEAVGEAVVNDDPQSLTEGAGEEVEDHSDSILPQKKHWAFRNWREWVER